MQPAAHNRQGIKSIEEVVPQVRAEIALGTDMFPPQSTIVITSLTPVYMTKFVIATVIGTGRGRSSISRVRQTCCCRGGPVRIATLTRSPPQSESPCVEHNDTTQMN